MRKILYILITMQLIIISLLGINIYQDKEINDALYKGTTQIALNLDEIRDRTKDSDVYMTELSKKYNVNISKYVKIDEQNLNVYTTDTSLGGRISLNKGSFPTENSKEFISNIDTKTTTQTGRFDKVNPNLNIKIKNITIKSEFLNGGMYYVSTIDPKIVEDIVNDLNINVGSTEIIGTNSSNRFDIRTNIYLIINLLLTFLFIIVAILHYSVYRSKEISILRVQGYTILDICIYIGKTFTKGIIKVSIITYVLILIYYVYSNGYDCIEILSLYFICISIIICLLYNTILLIAIGINIKRLKYSTKIKGKKNYNIISISNLILKFVFVIFLLFYVNLIVDQSKDINMKLNNLSEWKKTENVYFLPVKYNGENDMKIHNETSNKMKKLYNKLVNEKDVILIDPLNYTKYNGVYDFDLGSDGIAPEIKPSGKSIKINENYLKTNPIEASKKTIKENMIYNENTLNLLVPEKLKAFEEDIINNYRKNFHYEKIHVENIYNEEFGQKKNTTKEDELNINIIYVKNNQDYFSYKAYIEEDNNNLIRDPIAIIDTGNIHNSYYLSYMTQHVYIKSEKNDLFSDLYPLIKGEDLGRSFDKAISLYDLNASEIDKLQKQRESCIISLIILFLSNILVMYNITAAHYEKNKYKIYIQKIFGYNMVTRMIPIILKILSVNIIAIILAVLLFRSNSLILGLLIILIECILSIILERKLSKKMFNKILKGEH